MTEHWHISPSHLYITVHRSAPCDTDRQRTATSSLDIDSWFSHGAERICDEHCNIFPRHLYITVPLRSVRQWRVQHFNIGTSPLAIYTLPFRSAPCDTDRQRTATSSPDIDSWFSYGAERIGDEHCNIFPSNFYITVPLRSVTLRHLPLPFIPPSLFSLFFFLFLSVFLPLELYSFRASD